MRLAQDGARLRRPRDLAVVVQGLEVQPGVRTAVAGRPDQRRDRSALEVERLRPAGVCGRMGSAAGGSVEPVSAIRRSIRASMRLIALVLLRKECDDEAEAEALVGRAGEIDAGL